MKDLILGIDPGTRHAGYGIIACDGDNLSAVVHGVIHMKDSWSLPERLRVLNAGLRELYAKYPLPTTVVEKVFFGKNADSAFKLGHARGVCLLAAAEAKSGVAEYAARYVKKVITGSGAADKQTVQLLISNALRLKPGAFEFDASDALALAVTHARVRDVNSRLKQMLERDA